MSANMCPFYQLYAVFYPFLSVLYLQTLVNIRSSALNFYKKQQNIIKQSITLMIKNLLTISNIISEKHSKYQGMLLQRQKFHLNKLLDKYKSFEYLRPDPDIYQTQIPPEDHFVQISKDFKRRKIYYKVQYDDEQKNMIRQVRLSFPKMQIYQNFSDQIILKHLYATQMNIKKTLDRLKEVELHHNNAVITTFTNETQKKLLQGCIYTYGKDKKQNPIIIIRADRFDYKSSVQQNFNATYFLMLVVLGYRMVPYHAQKYTIIMDVNNMSVRDFSISYLYSILQKMNTIYCGNTQKTFIYNSSTANFLWSILSTFIPEHTKKKIHFIEKGRQAEILNFIDGHQLQKKYGGKLENLQPGQYWPPTPTNDFDKIGEENQSFQTDYDTILNNSFVNEGNHGLCGCGDCVIF